MFLSGFDAVFVLTDNLTVSIIYSAKNSKTQATTKVWFWP